MSNLEIRILKDIDVFEEAEEVQRSAWGIEDITIVPAHLLEAINKYKAGLVIGAYLNEHMLGFMLVLETRDKKVHHLHMIGVRSSQQGGRVGLHVGESLFRFYEKEAKNLGVEEVRWTFDPLLGVNASLYFHKLRAQVVRYIPDAYSDSSKVGIYQGLPADRLLVSWSVDTFRTVLAKHDLNALTITASEEIKGIVDFAFEIPADINELKKTNLASAQKARAVSRDVFDKALSVGYEIVDFVHNKESGRNFYIFHRKGN